MVDAHLTNRLQIQPLHSNTKMIYYFHSVFIATLMRRRVPTQSVKTRFDRDKSRMSINCSNATALIQ